MKRVASTMLEPRQGWLPAGMFLAPLLVHPACAPPEPRTSDAEIDLTAPEEQRLGAYTGLVPCSAEPEATGCARESARPSPASPERSDVLWFVPVSATDPVRGPRDALVTIVVFSDFECPHCRRAAQSLEQLLHAYPRDVRVAWKDDPLPRHTRARTAALFARAAQAQRGDVGFWAAHDALYAHQPAFAPDDLEKLAAELGLDWDAARRAVDDERDAARVDAGSQLSTQLGLRATPTLFINGRKIEGARPTAELRAVVDSKLGEARRTLARGAPRDRLYEHLIQAGKQRHD